MKRKFALAPLLALSLVVSPALVAKSLPAATQPAASIPFANQHGVRDWVAEGDQTIYVQDSVRRWYRARLFAPSVDLLFVQTIGFDTGSLGSLDRWSTVIIRGQRYPLQSFERVAGPPAKRVKPKADAKN